MAAASSQPKETECAVCMNDFTTPKILPCGHLLCRDCVISWVNLKPDAGCPLCRCPIVQTQGHSDRSSSDVTDALPTDFAMEALVDSATALSKSQVCCACDDVKAEFICMQCLDLLCPSCCRIHNKMSATRNHDVQSLSSVTPELLAASRPALCADHQSEKQSVFCSDHGVSVCTSCAFTTHRSCANIKDIDSEVKSAEESIKRLTNILRKAERELEQSIADIDKRLQEVNVCEQTDIGNIDNVCKRLKKLVKDFCSKMKEISRNSHSEVKKSLHDIKSSLGQRLGVVTSHKRIMTRTKVISPRPTLIQATNVLQDRVKSLDLRADLKIHVWGNPPSYGTRCHDVIIRIENELQMATKRSTDLEETISAEAQTFWQQWVEAAFPDLDSRAYFLPPVYVNHVTTGQSSAGQPPSVHHSDVSDNATLQRVFCCLQKMSQQNGEVLVGMSQLQFGQYPGQPCYVAAAAHLLKSSNLCLAQAQRLSAGDFDVLLIQRRYGLVALKVKCFGDNIEKLNMSQLDLDNTIRRNVKDAVSQLDKTKAILSQLVSDIAPGLRTTQTIAFPNLMAHQVQQAISGDPQLTQDARWCLGTPDRANISGMCLCSDQLSDPRTPWDVSSDVIKKLANWWRRCVAVSGPDSHMTCDLYKTLVARFYGPAATVAVPCTSPPRLCVKSLGQAVSLTGECYTAHITLFPEQVRLLNMAPPRLFVAGPPGTGKTAVLLLMAIRWLRCGSDVYIVSTWLESRAECSMLYHLLLQIVNSQETAVVPCGRPRLLQYNFRSQKDVEKAVTRLSQASRGGALNVIADGVRPVATLPAILYGAHPFQTFCDELRKQVPRHHLWAASCYHGYAPAGWQVEYLTRPLRSPPSVVREVQKDREITVTREVLAYSERGVFDHTDGPPIRRLYHRGQGHTVDCAVYCVKCGREVASVLYSLRVGVPVNVATSSTPVTTTSGGTTASCLQWRDMLVLSCTGLNDESGVEMGLKEAGIPVRVMKDDDIEDVATARSDVVWMAYEGRVRGLERKVVVCLVDDSIWCSVRLHVISRCTSQLVIVSR